MKTLKYSVIIYLLISLQLFAQEYNCITVSLPAVAAQNKGRFLPSEGIINVLIVFAEFPDDNYDINNARWVKGNAPQNMNNWIDQTWSSNPTQGSLTHYFNEMSGNKLHLIGKEVHVVAPHTRDWYLTNYTNYRRGYIQREIIQQLDATWDFGEFDNWDFVSDYINNNTADTYVDMIIFVWRNISADRSYPTDDINALDFAKNYGDLGGVGDNMNEFTVDGGVRKIKWNYGGSNSIPLGSGVTVRNYLTEDPFKPVIHEFAHYLIGGNEYHNGFGFWGMVSAWGVRSYVANAFERYRLGWVADSTSYTISNTTNTFTNRTLSDFVTGGNAYRFVINTSQQEYFFIENHQKTSYWENNAPFWGSQGGTVENGIYVIRKAGTPDYYTDPYSWLQLIPADGRFNWEVNQSVTNPWGSGQLPVFKQVVPNKASGYHDNQWIPFSYGGLNSPDAIHFTEQNGSPVQDVRFHGDGKDAYRMDYNQVFSPWSNPNNQRAASQTTPFGFEITNFSNGVYTLNIYVNTSIDASPSKPQNLHFTYADPYHPSLGWDLNTESDISSYRIYRSYDNSSYWDLVGTVSHPTNTFIDYEVSYTKPVWAKSVKYYVVAIDNTSLSSVPSDQVETTGIMNPLPKINADDFANATAVEKTIYNFELNENYPNPFNPTTKISFSIPQKSQIKLKVIDVLGKEIQVLADGVYEAGKFEVNFDASKLPSGVYFYNLTTGTNSITKKMLLMK
ncbi:MAG: T9SS type A sorting domain-containing protein [Melioribacteraceae bacterium]